jgi:myo-inositol-1(or 4)-monophosphatase
MAGQREIKRVMFEAAEAARRAILRHYCKLESIGNKANDPTNLVTIADKQAEKAIIGRIRRAFPDHGVLAEESGASQSAEAEYCWVIDPLDGTANYAHTMPVFSTSIGVQRCGETIMGLVVDPTRDEWFFARRGGGAFLNRRRIHVSAVGNLEQALTVTGFSHDRRRHIKRLMKTLGGVLMRAQSVARFGSAALDLCSVACGRAEAYWSEGLDPWDVAAGLLIVEEAGGRTTNYADHPSNIFDKQFVASNGRIHAELLSILQEHWRG